MPDTTTEPQNDALRGVQLVGGGGTVLQPNYGASWAVVIGINHYHHKDMKSLDYAVSDAAGMAELLITRLGFPKEQVLVVLEGGAVPADAAFQVLSTQATKQTIEQLLFTELPKKATGRDDRVLVFFAGHGERRKLPGGRAKGYLAPSDAEPEAWHTYVEMDAVTEADELVAAKHVFYLLDACYSGLATARAGVQPSRYQADMLTNKARQALTAGTAKQAVADKGPEGHSLFTWHVIQGLRGAADTNFDDVITASELMVYVKNQVAPDPNSQQTPDYGILPGHESGGDFIFLLPPTSRPLDAREYYELGAGLHLAGQFLDEPRRFRAAADAFAQAADLARATDELLVTAKFGQGRALLAAGDPAGAQQSLAQLLQNQPPGTPPETGLYMGLAHAGQRDFEAAAGALESFSAHYPQHTDAAWAGEYARWIRAGARGNKLALLIGCNTYRRPWSNLNGCVNDARMIQDVLITKYGFATDDVKLLLDEEVTRQGVLAAFEALQKTTPADTVVVHYSGHSIPETHRQQMKMKPDDQSYLVLSDSGWDKDHVINSVTADELHALMKAVPASHKTLILDTHPSTHFNELVEQEGNYTLLLATDSAETAYEHIFELNGRPVSGGLFTGALTARLSQADPLTLTNGQLIDDALAHIQKLKYNQTPVLIGNRDQVSFGRDDLLRSLFDLSERRCYKTVPPDDLQRQYQGARTQFTAAFPRMHAAFGRAFLAAGEAAAAIGALQTALQQAPEDNDALLQLGRAQIEARCYADALATIKAYEAKAPPAASETIPKLLATTETLITARKRALLVGINRYNNQKIAGVKGAANDVAALKSALMDCAGFAKEDIVVLLDGDATSEAILSGFKMLVDAAESPALFYFAGNGSLDKKGKPTLVPVNGRLNGISDISLAALAEMAAGAANLVAICDAGWTRAFHRGEGARMISAEAGLQPLDRDLVFEPRKRAAASLPLDIGAVSIYTGSMMFSDVSKMDQPLEAELPALDKSGQTRIHGVLTHALIRVLQIAEGASLTYRSWTNRAKSLLPEKRRGQPLSEPYVVGVELDAPIFSNPALHTQAQTLARAIEQAPIRRAIELLHRLEDLCRRKDQDCPDIWQKQKPGFSEKPGFLLGIAEVAVGDYDPAITNLTQAVKSYDDLARADQPRPVDPGTQGRRHDAHYHLGRALFEKSLRAAAAARRARGSAAQQALEELEAGFARAVAELTEATRLDKQNARAYYYLGRAIEEMVQRVNKDQVERAYQAYLNLGAPLGHEDEIRTILGSRLEETR